MLQIHASASIWIGGDIDPSSMLAVPHDGEEELQLACSSVEEAYHSWQELVRSGVTYLHLSAARFENTGTADREHFDQVAEHQFRIKSWLFAVRQLRYSLPGKPGSIQSLELWKLQHIEIPQPYMY